MKKSLYSILAAATLFGFAACDDGNYTNWADPIVNPQEEVKPGVSVSFASTGDLIDYESVGQIVKLFNASGEVANKYEVVFSNGTVIETSSEGLADAEELKAVVVALFGKAPEIRTIEAKAIAYLNVDGAGVKIEKPIEIQAKLVAPQISSRYYLIGAPSQWNPQETSLKFNHNDNVSVYDDPIFTITFPVSAGDTWFAFTDEITVESGEWSDVFGCVEGNGKNGMDGFVARRKDLSDDGSFMLHADNDCYVKMTLNMMDYSYHFDFINYDPFIYFIGATDGWSSAVQKLALTDENSGTYTGYLYCADPNGWGNQFKFQKVPGDWSTEINSGNFTTFLDAAVDCGGNIGVSGGESVYYFSVSLGNSEIKAIEVKTMSLIGNFNGWNGDLEMTWNAAEWCFEADMTPVDQDGWKFRVNNDWGLNLGGASYDNLVNGGDNLNGTGSKCKLYPTRIDSDNIYCVVE